MTVLSTLFHPSEGTTSNVIMPIASGRFVIAENQADIVDTETGTTYQGNPLVESGKRRFTNITGLTDTEILSIPYLYGLAVNPLFLPEAILKGVDTGPKAFFSGAAIHNSYLLNAGQVIWIYPDGGIESSIPGYKYVPFASKYVINDEGDIKLLDTGDSILSGHNRDGIYTIELDRGGDIDIDVPNLMVLAFGKYDETNYLDEPKPLNTDAAHPDYLKLSNWLKTLIVDTDKYVADEEIGTRLIP